MAAATDMPRTFDEPPELTARTLAIGGRLAAGAIAFFFVSFLFAFFYLRALDSNHAWRHTGKIVPNPSIGFGVAILVCFLAAAAVARFLVVPALAGGQATWRTAAWATLALVAATIVLQAIEWATLGWGPTEGGYASVFLGWTGFLTIFAFGALWWLATIVVERDSEAGRVSRLASASAFALVWLVLAIVEVAAFILLYLVK